MGTCGYKSLLHALCGIRRPNSTTYRFGIVLSKLCGLRMVWYFFLTFEIAGTNGLLLLLLILFTITLNVDSILLVGSGNPSEMLST